MERAPLLNILLVLPLHLFKFRLELGQLVDMLLDHIILLLLLVIAGEGEL